MSLTRLAGFRLVAADAEVLAAFYETALGFERVDGAANGASEPAALARRIALKLGAERVELVQFVRPGAPYPPAADAAAPLFQHLALVAPDMEAAYRRLCATAGWRPISTNGPERLPDASGGATAFKFRDPEGHPLELLAFAPGAAPARWRAAAGTALLGVDHSAIRVADTARSVRFYEGLGLRPAGASLNRGEAQARLDGLADPVVEVTALSPPNPTPHLELLCYDRPSPRPARAVHDHDIAATRLILEGGGETEPGERCDPDGHRLRIVHRAGLPARNKTPARGFPSIENPDA